MVERSPELRLQSDETRYTLPRFLADVVARHSSNVAIRCDGASVRYAELGAASRATARGLIGAGVVKGARVGLLMSNRPEWVVSAFAVAQAGGVLVPINTFASADELDHILRHGDVSLLLMQSELLGHGYLADLLERHPGIAESRAGRIRCEALPQLRAVYALDLDAQCGAVQAWPDLLEAGVDVPDALLDEIDREIAPSDEGLLIYTSGTTAQAKGVLHMQRAPVIQSWRFAEHMALSSDDRVWTVQPFFWTAGICMSLGATLAAGATLILQENFEAGAALDCIESEGATTLHAWPHQNKAMAEHPSARQHDLSKVAKIEFSTPLAALAGIEKDEWGIYGSYGLSETFTICSAIPSWAPAKLRSGTSGKVLPGNELRILDPETGEGVPPGEPGEIGVRGLTLMRGYYKVAPEFTLDGDGFFLTQDGGHVDSDGYLHWSGRLGNLIKTGGANVSPLEIDGVLQRYPGLEATAAVGVPHPTLGEVIVLCAVASSDPPPHEDSILAHVRQKLAAYKVPRRVLFFSASELPLTGTAKIQVGALREAALARLVRERADLAGHTYGAADA